MDKILSTLLDLIKVLPLSELPRNTQLREDILRRIAAQLLTDDERAELFGLPAGCRIREGAKILSPENLFIGERCWIGENAVLDASGGLTIGSDCSIGLSVFVWSHASHLSNLARDNRIGSQMIQKAPTFIGNGVSIFGPSVILPGTKIGDNVVIRPMSTVSGVVKSGSLVDRNRVISGVFTEERVADAIRRIRRNDESQQNRDV